MINRVHVGYAKKAIILLAALSISSFSSFAAGYKGIRVGQKASELPKSLELNVVFMEGEHEGDWFRVNVLDGRVITFTVIYSGKSLDGKIISRSISLAAALKFHSLQPENAPAYLGEAVGTDGQRYGIIDSANQIVYTVASFEPSATVKQVTYVSSSAPVLISARSRPLAETIARVLLLGARAVSEKDALPTDFRLAQQTASSGLSLGTEGAKDAPEPFGFKIGMTKAQVIALVGQRSVSKEGSDSLQLTTAPMPHPDFERYVVSISPSTGLAQVIALSKDIETSVYGDALRSKFDDVKSALSSKYGPPSDAFDFLRSGSIWNEQREWMMGLLKEERTLNTFWKASGNVIIELEAAALSQQKGYLRLSYQLPNFDIWLREHNEKKNSVF